MVQSWCMSTNDSPLYMGFPELDSSDTDTVKRVHWWNRQLASEGLKVVAGGQSEIRLNDKGWAIL